MVSKFGIYRKYNLKGSLVLILLFFTFIWYGVLTPVIWDASHILKNSILALSQNNSPQRKTFNTSLLDQFNLFKKKENVNSLLVTYVQDTTTLYRENGNLSLYPESSYGRYIPTITYKNILPLLISDNVANIIYITGSLITIIIKISVFLGILYMIRLSYKKDIQLLEYSVLCIGFGLIIFFMVSLPVISLNYPTGRLYQQALFVLSLPTIIFLNFVLSFIKKQYSIVIIALLFVVNFLFTVSFVTQFVGNNDVMVYLNNSGKIYNEIFLHESELTSISWLSKHYDSKYNIFSDRPSENKITTYSNIPWTFKNTFPSTVDRNSYVYLSRANTLYGVGTIYLRYSSFEYNFPDKFIAENKNLIYNNGESEVFK
jgi:hypothetical protein